MRRKLSFLAICGLLIFGAFSNYAEISHPQYRLTAFARSHPDERDTYTPEQDNPSYETDVPATLMKLSGINTTMILFCVAAFLIGGFRFQDLIGVTTRLEPPIRATDAPREDTDDYFDLPAEVPTTPKLLPKLRRSPAKPAKTKIGRLAFLGCWFGWLALFIGWDFLFNYAEAADPNIAIKENMEALFVILPSCIAYVLIFAFRLRSMGYSGWMALLALIPVMSLLMFISCVCMPPSDKPEPFSPKVVLYVLYVVIAIVIVMAVAWALEYQK